MREDYSFGGRIRERDIDLLLAEEFWADDDFCRWFIEEAGFDAQNFVELLDVNISVNSGNGESDLEVTIRLSDMVHRLLIENKVSALFQPTQDERYQTRGESYVEQGNVDGFSAVLVAPEAYEKADVVFDAHVTYEQLLDWFDHNESLGNRGRFNSGFWGAHFLNTARRLLPEELSKRTTVGIQAFGVLIS